MRKIPSLTNDIVNRAAALSAKARQAREAAPGVVPPTAEIAPATVVNGKATLRLYDVIDPDGGFWGISADEFAQALGDAGDVSEIELRINSGGGSVWDGLAILNTLRSHNAGVTAVVDGVAASAASFIAVASDEVVMMPNSRLMIHDALGICIGQAADMLEYGAFLDETSDNIAAIYADRAGGTTQEWRKTMAEKGLLGQWYSAQEAVDAGLADKVFTGQTSDNTDSAPDDTSAQKAAEKAEADKRVAMTARNRAKKHELAAQRHGFTAA